MNGTMSFKRFFKGTRKRISLRLDISNGNQSSTGLETPTVPSFDSLSRILDFTFDKDIHAQWCSKVLNVDKEIKAHLIQRIISHEGPHLHM